MKTLFLTTAALICSSAIAAAASIRDISISATNPDPFVGEDFALLIEIKTTPGCEINNISLSDLPSQDYLSRGELEILPVKSAGDDIFIHTVKTKVCPLKSFSARIEPLVTVDIVSRGNIGFFSTTFSEQKSFRLNGFKLSVKPLPLEGRPDDFRGTIGSYSISSTISPAEIAVGDIVKFEVKVSGAGHITPEAPVLPEFDKSLFKTYSPKTEVGKDGTISIVQTIVPLSTQAVNIASAKLPYFDSTTHSYRVAETEPLKISFHQKEEITEPDVRELIVSGNSTSSTATPIISGGLFPRGDKTVLTSDAELHIAPSDSSKTICVLPAQSTVYAVEKYGTWIRVRSQKTSGWMKK